MLVNAAESNKEGAIRSNLVHPARVPVCRVFTGKKEGSEEREMATSLKEVSSETSHDCNLPLDP